MNKVFEYRRGKWMLGVKAHKYTAGLFNVGVTFYLLEHINADSDMTKKKRKFRVQYTSGR